MCRWFLGSERTEEPLERLLKIPDRSLTVFCVGFDESKARERSAVEALEAASDLSDRFPLKTAARRRILDVWTTRCKDNDFNTDSRRSQKRKH